MSKKLKSLKLSKTGLLILSAGIFIVVLGGLGITRSGQLQDQSKLTMDLATFQMRMDKLDTSQEQKQYTELSQQLEDSQQQLAEVKDKLHQKITSADVTAKLYEIADYYSVNVTVMGTTSQAQIDYEDVPCTAISLTATARGPVEDIVSFAAGLNNNFSTGYIQQAQFVIPEPDPGADPDSPPPLPNATITIVVYSYEGS